NLFLPLDNPKLTIQRRSRTNPTLLNNSEMATEGPGDLPVPDLQTIEELCQPSLNGRVQNSCQFHGLPGDDANKHLDKFLHVTQSIKVNGVTDDAFHLYLFLHSLTHHATAWFDRLPRNSINTFEQMAKMFLEKYFPPSMVTKLGNEITNFCQLPDESLFEAWERYKLSIDRCPNHNMLPVTQIYTFYNGLTLRHRDTINVAAEGTFMKRRLEECYDLIENMIAHHNDWDTSAQWSESSSSITSFFDTEIATLKAKMAEINKNLMRVLQVNQQVKAVTSNCETCGGPHSFSNCLATVGKLRTFMLWEPIKVTDKKGEKIQAKLDKTEHKTESVEKSTVKSQQKVKPDKIEAKKTKKSKRRNRRHSKQPFILEESLVDTMADQRTMAELLRAPTEGFAEAIMVPPILAEQFELKHILINMMTSDQFFGLEKDNPHDHIRWHGIDTKISFVHALIMVLLNYTNLILSNPADQDSLNSDAAGNLLERQIAKLTHAFNQQTSVVTTAMTAILKQFQTTPPPASVKAIEDICVTCGAVILKKLPEKLGDPGKFLIPCGFSKLKCKSLADLGASINLMPLSVWNKLGLPELISTRMTLELANRAICTPAVIARDVFVSVGKFAFLDDFVIIDYESDLRVPLILGRLFLRTARALIEIHGEEMILRDGDERLTLNMRHDTSSYSNQPQKESINLINVFNNSNKDFLEDLFSTNQPSGNPIFSSHPELNSPEVKDDIFDPEGGNVLPEKLLDLDSTKDLLSPHHINSLSGSTTYFSSPNQLLEEFADELALITFPPEYDDDLQFDIESDLKKIEFLLHKDIDPILKDSIAQSNFADLNDNLVDSIPEMFTDEHALDYSPLTIFDECDDDLFEVESDTKNVYDDPFDSKGEEIKESKLLIDELDLPCEFLPSSKYD
nr:reverse transcriptase domain-containing protein [Tanacetum cinerariifolium]